MPRFYFDIEDDHISVVDEEGVAFGSFATMEREALRAVGTMVSELSEFPLEPWTMTIRDDQRRTVATLTLVARSVGLLRR